MDITKAQRVSEPRSGTGGDAAWGHTPRKARRATPARAGPKRKPGQGRRGARRPKATERPTRQRRRDPVMEAAHRARHTGKNLRRKA